MDLITKESAIQAYEDSLHGKGSVYGMINNCPSAFDGKTNWEALKTIFPYAEIVGGDITLTAVRIDTTGTGTPVCLYTEWLDAPYSTIPKVRNEWTI